MSALVTIDAPPAPLTDYPFDLAGFIGHQADHYRLIRCEACRLVADVLDALARKVEFTNTNDPDMFRHRAELAGLAIHFGKGVVE